MFKKLKGLASGGSKSKGAVKYKFDVQVVQLEGVPGPVKKCRVVWSRSAKMQMTEVKECRNGVSVCILLYSEPL